MNMRLMAKQDSMTTGRTTLSPCFTTHLHPLLAFRSQQVYTRPPPSKSRFSLFSILFILGRLWQRTKAHPPPALDQSQGGGRCPVWLSYRQHKSWTPVQICTANPPAGERHDNLARAVSGAIARVCLAPASSWEQRTRDCPPALLLLAGSDGRGKSPEPG